jgi:transcriptional regulator of arginine metabolism
MRYSRQNKIIEIINNNEVDTQEKLASLLKEEGFEVTQATISRDIKELQLVKTLSSSGKYKYAVNTSSDLPLTDRFVKIFRQTVVSIDSAENLIIVKTLSGCANAAGEAIDTSRMAHIKGSIAGDNTLLIIVDEKGNVPAILSEFSSLMEESVK